MKKVYRRKCSRCNTDCKLRAIGSINDPYGEKYGAIFICPKCKWDDWGNIINVGEITDFYSKKNKRVDNQ